MSRPNISNYRLIVSGNTVEAYVFERPIGYNLESDKRKREYYGKSDNPQIHPSAISRTQNNVIRTINSNAYKWFDVTNKPYKPQFLTCTFKENIKDIDYANEEHTNYIKRMNYHFYQSKKSILKYLTVIEFQKRGAIHYHTVFFNLEELDPKKERETREIANIWGHGFVDIIPTHSNNIGFYIAKYMTKDTADKRLIGRRRYFCSKKLKRPTIFHQQNITKELITNLKSIKNPHVLTKYKSSITGETHHAIFELTDTELQEVFSEYNLEI
ncbi:hypothetical protein N9L18_00525 [Candidatus Pacebacteria bacterium]|nr:hypothetical protein [Candidatus Paceibacterota bacterium]